MVTWDIQRGGRAWGDEALSRYQMTPEKTEMDGGRLYGTEEERLTMLALLLENVGADKAVRLGSARIWRGAVAALNEVVEAVMITLQADFNHMDAGGRLRLGDLRMHQQTPFAEIAAKHETIIFVDGDDMVRGELVHDPEHGWIGHVDWSTQDVWESYPPAVAARG